MRVRPRQQNGTSTADPFDYRGASGLAALGASVRTDDVDRFRVSGTQWGFGRSTVTELTLSSFEHSLTPGTPLGFPVLGSVSIVYILGGSAHVVIAGSSYYFGEGTAAVLSMDQLPRVICGAPVRLLIVSVETQTAELTALLPDRFSSMAAAVVRTHPALTYFLALIASARSHRISTELTAAIIASLLKGLLVSDRNWHTRSARPGLTQLLDLISTRHADLLFDRRLLARAADMSVRRLDRLLLDLGEDKSATELIDERRMITAMTLLRPESMLSIERIAERCGFVSSGALDTAVERVYGVTATALLQSQRPAAAGVLDRPRQP
jgi:AraC-like DNA-binding protein